MIGVGISGWRYGPWRGVFYPPGLVQADELEFASRQFSSIEINGTFYSLQRPESFARWHDATPGSFVFAVKAPRYITHILRLRDAEEPLANFLASGVLRLGAKLGPILWQLPPSFRFDPARVDAFLSLLPHDTQTAARMARKHAARIRGRVWLETDVKRPLRHAMEIRHESFAVPAFVTMLRKYRVALVCADTVEWPRLMDVTADFMYCRLHGSTELYRSGYGRKALRLWARRVKVWAAGREPTDATRVSKRRGPKRARRDVFVYFDNTDKLRAPRDARAFAKLVGAGSKASRPARRAGRTTRPSRKVRGSAP
ncbi:MAG: DUF72 domain-containing protein [Alphaproteobacteria bacterium]